MRASWPRFFRSDETIDSVLELDVERLLRQGVRAVLFDLDHTLDPGRPQSLSPAMLAFLQSLMQRGLRVGIISNRRFLSDEQREALRVEGVPALYHAGKPRRRAFLRMLTNLDVEPASAVFVGNRRFTDVLGARRAGLSPILVRNPPPEPGAGG